MRADESFTSLSNMINHTYENSHKDTRSPLYRYLVHIINIPHNQSSIVHHLIDIEWAPKYYHSVCLN